MSYLVRKGLLGMGGAGRQALTLRLKERSSFVDIGARRILNQRQWPVPVHPDKRVGTLAELNEGQCGCGQCERSGLER